MELNNLTDFGEFNPLNKGFVVGAVLAPKEQGRTGYCVVLKIEKEDCLIMSDFGNILTATKKDILCCYTVQGQQNIKDRFDEHLTILNENYINLFGETFNYEDVRVRTG